MEPIALGGFVEDDVDLADGRRGHGGLLALTSTVQPAARGGFR